MLDKEENKKRLDRRISKLDLGKGNIIVFDFDELVVPIHLTKEVTQAVSERPDLEKLNKLGSCSFEGILYLNSLLSGLDLEEYKEKRDKIVNKTSWRKGFGSLLRELMKTHSIIFISSGMKDIAETKLREINMNPNNIFGGELDVANEKINGSSIIISDELKGYIVKKIGERNKIIGIGHGKGDILMLHESDISIGFNSDILDLAQYEVQSPEEILRIIKENP